jgi:hypothetical protein
MTSAVYVRRFGPGTEPPPLRTPAELLALDLEGQR